MTILGVISSIFTLLLFLTNFKRLKINKLSHMIMMSAIIINFIFCVNMTWYLIK